MAIRFDKSIVLVSTLSFFYSLTLKTPLTTFVAIVAGVDQYQPPQNLQSHLCFTLSALQIHFQLELSGK